MKITGLKRIFSIRRRDIFIGLIAINLASIFVLLFTYLYFAKDLQSKEGIMNSNDTGVTLLDRNNQPFFTFYSAKYKSFIPLSDISLITQQSVIASEDKDFYTHPGFSIKSILRSFILDLQKKDLAYGGSTLTQQLVKNSLLTSQKSFLRKYQEIILAQEIERRYSKKEILEMYLNSVYFGEGAFGIEEASQTYYGKHAKDLDLAESSLLTAILPSPSALSPLSGNLDEAKKRQKIVLDKMIDQKYITKDQEDQALNEQLAFHPENRDINSKAPHFALMVKDELIKKYGEETISRSGFKVKTSIDLGWQAFAEEAVKNQVEKLAGSHVSNGAAIVIDPKNGEIRVMVGSKDWYDEKDGKFNVTLSPRQPGSSFKPIVYVTALEKHIITPATVLKDEPVSYHIQGSPDYKPLDYDRKFRGQVIARRALANSLNIPAVEVLDKVGVPAAVDMAQKLGITTLSDPSQYGLSLVLGAAEVKLVDLTGVYATFANQGKRIEPTSIVEIRDKRDNVIYQHVPQETQVIEPEYAFQIASMLSDSKVRQEEFGNVLDTSVNAAVKTGTTENYHDSLTMGFTNSVAVGIWIGNNDNTEMEQVAGSIGAAPIFKALVDKFSDGPAVFTPPDGVVALTVCKSNGLLLKDATSSGYTEYFARGTEPTAYCYSQKPTSTASPSPAPSASATPTPPATPSLDPTPTPPPTPKENGKAKNG